MKKDCSQRLDLIKLKLITSKDTENVVLYAGPDYSIG
jgi:hypothetical protein